MTSRKSDGVTAEIRRRIKDHPAADLPTVVGRMAEVGMIAADERRRLGSDEGA